MEALKKKVGYASVDYIENGMVVGLGTGSTAYYMVERLGQRIQGEGLEVICVTTSKKTAEQACELGIPLRSLDEVDRIDLTIDGADEIDPNFQGIKGGGGALLVEKIVASYSDKIIWIVDESKLVPQLGAFPLAVEVIPFGHQALKNKLEQLGYRPKLREDGTGHCFKTDNDNYIIDLHLEKIEDPYALSRQLLDMPGVVEHGLFLDMADLVLVGKDGEVDKLERLS